MIEKPLLQDGADPEVTDEGQFQDMHRIDHGSSCRQCGATLPRGPLSGYCPVCLLDSAVNAHDAREDGPLAAEPGPCGKLPSRFGRYQIVEEISRGGAGVVYRARDEGLHREVALKFLRAGPLASRDDLRRLYLEARAAARLHHPNIVPVFEIGGPDDAQPFLAMAFLPGGTLAEKLKRGAVSPREAARLLGIVASAVHHAHQHGILHRDLKPGNILFDATGAPMVADFGLSRFLDEDETLTRSDAILGTPAYLSPEQAAGHPGDVTTAGDIHALGAVLYELLTGRPPFAADHLTALLRQIAEAPPVAPRLIKGGVPADLETICLKCLEKEPDKRYGTALEVAEELDRFLRHQPIRARSLSRVEQAWRWCKRKPALASALAIAALFLLVLLVGGPVIALRMEHLREQAEAARRETKAQAYPAQTAVAQQAWEEGDLRRARELLASQIPDAGQPDLRGFEWRYLWSLCQDKSIRTVTLEGNDPIGALATTPAHRFAAAASHKAIRLLDPSTGLELSRLAGPESKLADSWHVLALASGATNLLAAACNKSLVSVWEVSSQRLLFSFRAFSNNVDALALSPDGRFLAASEANYRRGKFAVWDISPGQLSTQPLWSQELKGSISALTFSQDGQALIGAEFHEHPKCGVWETKTGLAFAELPSVSEGSIHALALSPNGSLLAYAGVEGRISVFDFQKRVLSFYLPGHSGDATSLAFSADSKRLVSTGADGTVRIWDIPAQKALGLYGVTEGEPFVAVLAPDSRTILSAAGSKVQIWNAAPKPPFTALETGTSYGWPAVSPNGKWLVATDGVEGNSDQNGAQVWDLRSLERKFHLRTNKKEPLAVSFSPDGQFFALGDVDQGGIALWDTSSWESASASPAPLRYLDTGFEAGSIAFSPDGKILAAAGLCFFPTHPSEASDRLAFWETGSWTRLDLLPGAGAGSTAQAAAASVAFSHDGHLLAIGYRDGWVRLWDFKRRRLIKALKRHADNWKGAEVCFSNDGRWLASIAKGGATVALFDLADIEHPREVRTFRPSSGRVWSALFCPDGKSLVTHCSDGLVKFWSLPSLQAALTLRHGPGPAGFLAFSTDGNLLASEDAHGTVKLWKAPPFSEIQAKE